MTNISSLSAELRRFLGPHQKPVVVLPFYGEFGFYLMSYVRLINYIVAPSIIVCCARGEESLFPRASGFYYDWAPLFPDAVRCGLRDRWEFGEHEITEEELLLASRLKVSYPEMEIIELKEYLPFELVKDFPVDIQTPSVQQNFPLVDLVIAPRRRITTSDYLDDGVRNFSHWSYVAQKFISLGLSFAEIGKRESSLGLTEAVVRTWEEAVPLESAIYLMRNAQWYLGTDSGVSHLAALIGVRSIVFRNDGDGSRDLLTSVIEPTLNSNGFRARRLHGVWNNPDLIIEAVLEELRAASMVPSSPTEKIPDNY